MAATTSSRTLLVLSLLQTRRYWSGAALAERLGVSGRTLRRDVDRLRRLGYPVEAQRGVDGGYQLAPGAVLPPLVLDDEEAVALGVGLQAAIQGGTVVGIEEASVRALTKVVQVMPTRLRRRVDALASMTVPAPWGDNTPSVDSGVLTAIAQACRDTECLEFAYTARHGEQTNRRVEPLRLVLAGRRWYLVAWDLDRSDWRSFRLDRLSEPAGTSRPFRPRPLPADDAAQFVRAGIDRLHQRHQVEVWIHAPASAVRDRIGAWVTVEETTGDRCLVRMASDTLEWPMMALGAVGADFEIIAPPGLLDLVRGWADLFGRAAASAAS